MKIIDRYLATTILHSIGIVLFAAIGLEFFIMMVAELHDIGHNNYSVGSALCYVVLNLPEQIYQIFPMAGLIGMLMGLGLLANHSELIVLRQAGLSFIAITWRTFKTLIALIILLALVGEVIAPKASAFANQFKNEHLHGNESSDEILSRNVWIKDQNSFLHIHEIDKNQVLHNISWYEFDAKQQLKQISLAETGYYQHRLWHVTNVNSTIYGNNHINTTQVATAVWPFSLAPEVLRSSVQNPSDLSLRELEAALRFHQGAHTANEPLQLAFWKRLFQPIASLVMMLLAIPFIFGPLRSVSQSLRLVAGIAAGFSFYYCNQLLSPIVLLLQLPPILGAGLPCLLFGIVGLIMLVYQRR
jgi:lipopolysaccharide export system permease protein